MTGNVNGDSKREAILTAAQRPGYLLEPESIPDCLASRDRWILWSWYWNGKKWTKRPIQTSGRAASSTDPATWSDFSTAVQAAERDGCGLGFVFNGDGVVGVDLDDCRDPQTGDLANWAAAIVRQLKTYAEVSPSETGVKLFVIGELPDKFNKLHKRPDGHGEAEIYREGRFFCVTGQRVPGTPQDVQERGEQLRSVYQQLSDWKPAKTSPAHSAVTTSSANVNDRDTALRALAAIVNSPGVHFEDWLKVGMILHSVDPSDSMCGEWAAWSRLSDKHIDGECERRWKSFNGSGGVRLPTLCLMADEAGKEWRPQRAAESQSTGFSDDYFDSLQQNSNSYPAIPDEGTPTPNREPKLQRRKVRELVSEFPQLRRPVIDGVLRRGEVMNVIAPPKLGKSWLVLSLMFAIACGRKWLDRFTTRRGKVLLVDNELHPETLADRIPRVAMAMGLEPDQYQDQVEVISLRGKLMDLKALSFELMHLQPGEFDLIVLDAWYRLQPAGTDENANGDVTALYNILENVAERIGSAFCCIHHTTKGSQSEKAVTDVGSGAGAQARAADTHMVIRPHETDGAFVVAASVRSWAPPEPFVMRWEFPIFAVDEYLNPKDLKSARPRKASNGDESDADAQPREQLMTVLRANQEGLTQTELRKKTRFNGPKFLRLVEPLLSAGLVEFLPKEETGNKVDLYKATDGLAGPDRASDPDRLF